MSDDRDLRLGHDEQGDEAELDRLAVELRAANVRVCCLSPGSTDSAFFTRASPAAG